MRQQGTLDRQRIPGNFLDRLNDARDRIGILERLILSKEAADILIDGLTLVEGDGIDLTPDAAGSIVSVGLATPSGLSFLAEDLQIDDSVAGAGLTIASKTLAVGAGNGLQVTADAIGLQTPGTISPSTINDPTGNHTHALDTTGFVPGTRLVNAGAGLTGGGALSADITINVTGASPSGLTIAADSIAIADSIAGAGLAIASKVLAVGAGDGIAVAADAVSVDLATPSGLSFSVGNLQIDDSVAGAGLSITSKVLAVGQGDGIVVAADTVSLFTPGSLHISSVNSAAIHTHEILTSSNPGGTNAILASAADGGLQLIRFGIGVDPDTDNLIKMITTGGIGLGSAAGRLVFDDQATDIIRVIDADLKFNDGSTDILSIRKSGDVVNTSADILAANRLGLAAQISAYIFIDSDNNSTTAHFAVMKDAETTTGATELMRINEAGVLALGDTSDTKVTKGLIINQGPNDDFIATLKSSDISHGMTNESEADTYGALGKLNGANGGLYVRGFGTSAAGIVLEGNPTSGNSSKSTAAGGAVQIRAAKSNGGVGVGSMGTDENILTVYDNTTARLVVDKEGDLHYDGTNNPGAWDEFDDVGLIRLAQKELFRGVINSEFDRLINANREQLAAGGVVTFNADGHHFINMSAMQRLIMGATWQLHERIAILERSLSHGT